MIDEKALDELEVELRSIRIIPDDNKDSVVWRARFYKGTEGHTMPGYTAPHAICLAGLKALGVET